MDIAAPVPSVHMPVSVRAWHRIRNKLAKCKEKETSYSNLAYFAFGIAIPCALATYGDWKPGSYWTTNSVAALFTGVCGVFFMWLDSVAGKAKGATIDNVIDDMDDIMTGFDLPAGRQ